MEEQMIRFIYLILKATHDVIVGYMTWFKTHWLHLLGWWGILTAAAAVLTLLIWKDIRTSKSTK